jgi:spore coat protein CotH
MMNLEKQPPPPGQRWARVLSALLAFGFAGAVPLTAADNPKLKKPGKSAIAEVVAQGAAVDKDKGPGKKNKPKPEAEPGKELFAREDVLHIKIELTKTAMDQLRREGREYVRGTVTEGTNVYKDVAIHLKGAAGSYRPVDDGKPAFTLNFNKFTPEQAFYGLRKIHLNNSVQDPSYMTEYLCGELFRKSGVPATRVAYAMVELNDRKLGLLVLKEGFAKEFLGLYFKKTNGNLYDGGFLREISEPLVKESGSGPDDHSDLKALFSAAQERDLDKRWDRLQTQLDLKRFVSFMVMENMTWDWDGYVMHHNNYRVYHDEDTGKFVFFPHGMDQMFWEPDGPMAGNLEGIVALSVMRTAQGRRLYRQRYSEMFTNVFKVADLTNRINHLEARITPALSNYNAQAARELHDRARELREKVAGRAASIARQLDTPPPATLKFTNGISAVTKWRRQDEENTAQMEQSQPPEGKRLLTIQASKATVASWRARITLPRGRYRFEGMAKAAGIQAVKDEKGEGAGLRISGTEEPRRNRLTGDKDWTWLVFPIVVEASFEELELVCELRATAGKVSFDLDTLRLVEEK